jgi:hypothetical protein
MQCKQRHITGQVYGEASAHTICSGHHYCCTDCEGEGSSYAAATWLLLLGWLLMLSTAFCALAAFQVVIYTQDFKGLLFAGKKGLVMLL